MCVCDCRKIRIRVLYTSSCNGELEIIKKANIFADHLLTKNPSEKNPFQQRNKKTYSQNLFQIPMNIFFKTMRFM